MSVETSPLFLQEVASGQLVDAIFQDGITQQQVADWELRWKPASDEIVAQLKTAGVAQALLPQSNHWDWRRKAAYCEGSLSNPSFSIICEGMTQGMMILNTLESARLASQLGKSLIYIEYLEAAPWNWRHAGLPAPQYRGIGAAMMRAAIEVSKQEGFKGRVGLHSLPQSNDWYANRCGMVDLGADSKYLNLRYFEMTPELAEAFIAKGNAP